ncbi:TPA: hypothetical protein DCZ85_02825 [Candidatus Uhrbacteria bacterium]|nr:hypothetical protein [Candidatus Uhrbacteria bacterium]
MKKTKTVFATIITLIIPFIALAQDAVEIINPLGISDVRLIIARVIQGALSVSGTLALLMLVYGGILWLTDMGTGKQIQKGKDILIWSTLGIILIASAYVVTTAIFNAIGTGSVTGV